MFRWLARFRTPPVTKRSTQAGSLRVVTTPKPCVVEHVLPVPIGACPVSSNPRKGSTAHVCYEARSSVLEVVSLHAALRHACSGGPGTPRSAEELASWLATTCAEALGGTVVRVRLDLTLRPSQRLVVSCSSI